MIHLHISVEISINRNSAVQLPVLTCHTCKWGRLTSCSRFQIGRQEKSPFWLSIMRCQLNFSLTRFCIMCLRGNRYRNFSSNPDSLFLTITDARIWSSYCTFNIFYMTSIYVYTYGVHHFYYGYTVSNYNFWTAKKLYLLFYWKCNDMIVIILRYWYVDYARQRWWKWDKLKLTRTFTCQHIGYCMLKG